MRRRGEQHAAHQGEGLITVIEGTDLIAVAQGAALIAVAQGAV